MNYTIPFLFTVLFTLGNFAALSGQDFFLPASTDSPEALEAYRTANHLASNIHFEEARQMIDQALAEDPQFFLAYNYAAQVLASDEERPALIEQAMAIDANDFTPYERIMRDYLSALQTDPEAMPTEAMKALVAAYPETPEAYEWAYLHAAYSEQNPEAAMRYAQKMIELAPDYGPVHNGIAYLYMAKGEMEKAKSHLDRYLEVAPEEPNAYDSMGEYYAENGQFYASAKYYGKAAAMGMEGAWERAEKALDMLCSASADVPLSESRLSVVRGLYDSFAEGDIPAVLAVLDDEVVWKEAEGNPLADNNPYIGPDAVLNGVFARLGAEHEYFNLTNIELNPVGSNQVLATLRYDAKRKDTGREIDVQVAHLWTVMDGKVTAFQQYADTHQIAAAAKK